MKAIRVKKYLRFHAQDIIFLVSLTVLGFFLRIYLLNTHLFFGPEQGIDFIVVKDLVINHHLTLIGAKTDVGGIFHGPLYYYVLAIPFFLSQGNPLFIAYFFGFINAISVVFMFLLSRKLFDKLTAYIASILYSISFGVIVYSRWLSTHPLVFPLSLLFFYFLVDFLKGKQKALLFAALVAGLLGQAEFLNILFMFVILVCLIIRFFAIFKKTQVRILAGSFLIYGAVSGLHYLLFDIRHNWLITHSLFKLLLGRSGYYISFSEVVNQLSEKTPIIIGSFLGIPFGIFSIGIFAISLIVFYKKNRLNMAASIVTFWLFVPVVILIITRHQVLEQLFVLSVNALLLIVAYFLRQVFHFNRILAGVFLVVICWANSYEVFRSFPINQNVFFQTPQPDLLYRDQMKAVQYIYQQGGSKPFAIQAYTIPYYTQQGWEYLFWYYSKRNQKNEPVQTENILFVIVQPDHVDPSHEQAWLHNVVKNWGREVKNKKIGSLTVKELQTK
jgi:hypothetical protein